MPAPRVHFRAGFATVDLTPDPGTSAVELSGYAGRRQPATGVRDRIRGAVLALGGAAEPPWLLVALDLCALGPTEVAGITAACPGDPGRMLLCCSHTHSAPATHALAGCRPDPAYVRHVGLRVADAARRAIAEAVPCRLGWGRAAVAPLWANRRESGGPLDPRVHLLKVERADSTRAPLGALWSLACHPAVLQAEHRLISADWVGAITANLPYPSAFLQGFCGDQNPRVRGEAALASWAGLAPEIGQLWDVTPTAPAGPLRWCRRALALPRLAGPDQPAEVAAARIGNGRITFWPGDPHLAHALGLPGDCLGVGHTGATVGPVPERAAYARGGYEVEEAHRVYGFPAALAPEAGEALGAATAELLAEVG